MANRMIHTPSYLATATAQEYWDLVFGAAISGGWYVRSGGGVAARTFTAQSGWTIGFRFRYGAGTSTALIVQLYSAATLHCDLRFNQTTGCFVVTRNGTVLLTSTTPLASGAEYYVEIQFVVADSPSGVAILKVDGVTDSVINSSALDTRNAALASADTIQFFGTNAVSPDIKDIYINDNSGGVDDTFWGPIAVATLGVTGAGNSAQWTPSASTNASNVDDTAMDGDSTYNATTTNGHVDTFVASDTGYSSGTVKGVEWAAEMKRDNVTATSRVARVYRIGSTDYVGSDLALLTTYRVLKDLARVSPATSSAWTVSELDGMQIGYKRTAS